MHNSISLLAITIISLSLLATPTLASTCRNISISFLSRDDSSNFQPINETPLENVNCPTSNATCTVPRGVYDITVYRTLNISTTPEDEDAIFAIVQEAYLNRTVNATALLSQAWTDMPITVDTNDRAYSRTLFETKGGMNYTLGFIAYMRYGQGHLSGCDNETLNGMGVEFRAPYQTVKMEKRNVTEVAGGLYGSGKNLTADRGNAGERLIVGNGVAGLMALLGLGSAFAMIL